MLDVQHHKLIFCFFELTFEPGHLLLVILFNFFKLQLQKCEFFHSLLDPLLILAQHTVGSPRLRLKSLIDVLKLNDFALKFLKFSFELVSFSLNQLEFLLQ